MLHDSTPDRSDLDITPQCDGKFGQLKFTDKGDLIEKDQQKCDYYEKHNTPKRLIGNFMGALLRGVLVVDMALCNLMNTCLTLPKPHLIPMIMILLLCLQKRRIPSNV